MVADCATWIRSTEGKSAEVISRYAFKDQQWIVLEAKPAVIGGLAENDTSVGAVLSEPFKSVVYQGLAEALALMVWPDRDWTQSEPAAVFTLDRHGRKGGMA